MPSEASNKPRRHFQPKIGNIGRTKRVNENKPSAFCRCQVLAQLDTWRTASTSYGQILHVGTNGHTHNLDTHKQATVYRNDASIVVQLLLAPTLPSATTTTNPGKQPQQHKDLVAAAAATAKLPTTLTKKIVAVVYRWIAGCRMQQAQQPNTD